MIIILNLSTSLYTLCARVCAMCVHVILLTRSHFIRNTLDLHHGLMPLQSQFNNNKYVYISTKCWCFVFFVFFCFSRQLLRGILFSLFSLQIRSTSACCVQCGCKCKCRHYCLTLCGIMFGRHKQELKCTQQKK